MEIDTGRTGLHKFRGTFFLRDNGKGKNPVDPVDPVICVLFFGWIPRSSLVLPAKQIRKLDKSYFGSDDSWLTKIVLWVVRALWNTASFFYDFHSVFHLCTFSPFHLFDEEQRPPATQKDRVHPKRKKIEKKMIFCLTGFWLYR